MSCLWICLGLLWFQQSIATQEGVSVMCNHTVEVEAGEAVTINCTIYQLQDDCKGVMYEWTNTSSILCSSDLKNLPKYTCDWDKKNYVSLIISDVTNQDNYTISIITDCGTAESSPVFVQVNYPDKIPSPQQSGTTENPQKREKVAFAILGLFVTLIAVAIFVLLREKNRSKGNQDKNTARPHNDTNERGKEECPFVDIPI